ncbi:hypothetical protein ACIOZM_07715 [Pseudomonas sp. NPDC087346]|uniref:hypothetical protein n=1 Tax=Pseudomonas sp. NPDC087346 TaxID=3364438 RepID=UPI0037FF3CC8
MFIVKTELPSSSYIGGCPVLPPGLQIPKGENGIPLTFFFTIQFPASHEFTGYTLSFFSATSEFNEKFTIPEMLNTDLKNAAIPSGFLRTYQKYFKAYLFKTDTAEKSNTQISPIKLQYLDFSRQEHGEVFGWAGRPPEWVLEDEAPSTYEGKDLSFLLQVRGEQAFEIIDSAPAQKEMNIFGGEKDRKKRDYFFFNQNEVYFFGTTSLKYDNNIYIITQCE